jgi:hypothetical protein
LSAAAASASSSKRRVNSSTSSPCAWRDIQKQPFGSAFAGAYRVHYSVRGSGRDITIQAESSAEARRTVMDMFGPRCVVTGAHHVK